VAIDLYLIEPLCEGVTAVIAPVGVLFLPSTINPSFTRSVCPCGRIRTSGMCKLSFDHFGHQQVGFGVARLSRPKQGNEESDTDQSD